MKSFLRLFLILIVSNIYAAQDLQQEAFNVLAKSVRLKPNKILNQDTFKPAIQELTTFLTDKYNLPIITIRKAKAEEKNSPEIESLLTQSSPRTFTRQELNKKYEYIINGYYCKAPLIPLLSAIGAYLHFADAWEPMDETRDQQVDKDIEKFNLLLHTIINTNILTKDDLNTLYTIKGEIANQNITIKGTFAGVIFRYSSVPDINICLEKGGNPMVVGYYKGPSEEDQNKIVEESNYVGLLALYNQYQVSVIEKILNSFNPQGFLLNSPFGWLITKNKDGFYELKPSDF